MVELDANKYRGRVIMLSNRVNFIRPYRNKHVAVSLASGRTPNIFSPSTPYATSPLWIRFGRNVETHLFAGNVGTRKQKNLK